MVCICGIDHSSTPNYVCPIALDFCKDELTITEPTKKETKIPKWKRVVEYLAFAYFNWLIVVPSLVPFMIFWVGANEEQMWNWFYMSFFVSLYLGWYTIKLDNRFAPWFYKKMKMERNICEACGK